MKTNQAFSFLQRTGGIRAARIISDAIPDMSWGRLLFISWQLQRNVPVAKIIHNKWFYGLSFYTNRWTLDPRPDTEAIIGAVIADNPVAPHILDLGTGTGCIISALAKNISDTSGVGIDCCGGAIRVARKNISRLHLDKQI